MPLPSKQLKEGEINRPNPGIPLARLSRSKTPPSSATPQHDITLLMPLVLSAAAAFIFLKVSI